MQANLTDLFDTAHDPIVVLNHDGTIALASEGFRRVLGHEPGELLGNRFPSMFHRVDQDRAVQTVGKAFRSDTAMQLEGRFSHADGGYRWTTWSLRKSPTGTLYAMGRDESIRRQIEAAVRRRERRNRAMLDHAADVLLVVDRQLLITDANATAAAVLGLSRHALKGRHLAEVAPSLARQELAQLGDGDGLTIETELRGHDGESIDMEVRFEAFEFDGEAMIVGLARDIRERKAHADNLEKLADALQAARDEAQFANDAKTSFVTQMSHALRTPLGAILGYAELLTEDAGTAEMAPDLKRIHTAANQLLDLVDDVLDLARIESGNLEIAWEYIEFEPLFDELVSTIDPLHDGELTVSITTETPSMEADRARLVQMLLNLLTFAVRRDPTGPITLTVRDFDDLSVAFEVVDHGPAVTGDDIAKAFQPFATGGRTHEEGSGLGLAIARQIAMSMGGVLDAHVDAHDDKSGVRLVAVLPQSSSR